MIESVQKQLEHSLSVLAVESSHSWDDIEKQYRQLIQRWHPDRNSDENSDAAQSKFIEINSAYKVIKEYYLKNGGIPRPGLNTNTSESNSHGSINHGSVQHGATQANGPLLGTKKPAKAKIPLRNNKVVWGVAISLMVITGIGALLWSLDSRLAKNNRDRANIEKTDTLLQTKNGSQTQPFNHGAIKQSSNEVEQ